MIKGIIFDFDDTLGNRALASYNSYKRFVHENFSDVYDELECESIIQDLIISDNFGTSDQDARYLKLVEKYHMDESIIDKIHNWWVSESINDTVLFEDVLPTLEILKSKGYKLAVLTNGYSSMQNGKIDKVGIRYIFDYVAVSSDIGFKKPDSRAFDCVCEKIGLPNNECVYVGDIFFIDVYGAKKAGLTPVWFTSSNRYSDYPAKRIYRFNEILNVVEELNNE